MRLLRSLYEKLGSTRAVVVSFILCFVVSAFFWADKRPSQPIAFNHNKHTKNGVGCTDCHSGAQEGVHATLPDLSTCLTCHDTPLTKSPERSEIKMAPRLTSLSSKRSADIAMSTLWRNLVAAEPEVLRVMRPANV